MIVLLWLNQLLNNINFVFCIRTPWSTTSRFTLSQVILFYLPDCPNNCAPHPSFIRKLFYTPTASPVVDEQLAIVALSPSLGITMLFYLIMIIFGINLKHKGIGCTSWRLTLSVYTILLWRQNFEIIRKGTSGCSDKFHKSFKSLAIL
mgnify:CR=1 FL=1